MAKKNIKSKSTKKTLPVNPILRAPKKVAPKKVAPKKVAPTPPQSAYIQELSSTKTPDEKKAKAGHYVNNAQMLALLIDYKKAVRLAKREKQPKPKIPDILGKQLLLIAENLSHKPNFNGYPCVDEMIGDAIENCLMYFDNFDPKRSRYPFAYFTKIIYYAFIRCIQREKKNLYIKYKATQQAGILHEAETRDSEDGTGQFELYENISEFITKYEEAAARAKAKADAAARAKADAVARASTKTSKGSSKKPPIKRGLDKLFD